MTITGHLRAKAQGYRLWGAPHYGALPVIVVVASIMGVHILTLQGVHLYVTHVTSNYFVPLPVLVPVGFITQNKSLSHTQLQGFGNCNLTMCQKENWKYH